MKAECANFEIARMARIIKVSRAGYYKWVKTKDNRIKIRKRQQDFEVKILKIHSESSGTYGVRRIVPELGEMGYRLSRNTIAKYMKRLGIQRISPKLFKTITTISDSKVTHREDLVNRNFDMVALNMVWISDITYMKIGTGTAYLCSIRDEHSRRVIGYSVADHMRTEMVLEALYEAIKTRHGKVQGTIFHTDRGKQFEDHRARALLDANQIASLMERTSCTMTTQVPNPSGLFLSTNISIGMFL